MLRYAGDPVVRSGLPEPVGGRFGIVTKALLALAKRLLEPLAVLDVSGRPVPFYNVTQFITHRLGAEQKPAILAIEAPEPSFKLTWHTRLPYCAPLLQHALLVIRMKSARPPSFGFVRCEAGVVEGWLIEKVGHSIRSCPPDQRRDLVDNQSKAIFGFLDFVKSLLQRLLCSVLLSDIHMRTNQFDHIAVAIDDGMPHGMYAFYRAIRHNYPEVHLEMSFFPDSLLRDFDYPASVFS